MKKVLLSIVTVAGLALASNAQYCNTGASSCVPQQFDSVGLNPQADSLPCFVRGTNIDQTIYFKNYEAGVPVPGAGITVDSVRIDSVILTPGVPNSGICWSMNYANNVVPAGETGCLKVSGPLASTVPAGQYSLRIIVSVYSNNLWLINKTNAKNLPGGGLYYWIRVIDPSDDCAAHPIDTTGKATTDFKGYNGEVISGINDISTNVSQLSVQPNPFGTATTVAFTATSHENYSLKLTNLLGEVLHAEEVTATAGRNELTIKNNNYASGVYLLSLTNGKSSITKRVVIAE